MSDEGNSGISNKWKLRLAIIAGMVLFFLLFVTGVSSRHFICRDCAQTRTTTQIFGLEFQGDLEDTPFSRELSHLMLDGTHTWFLIHRRNPIGFGDTSTHGSWVNNTANSESVVSFIHDIERFEGRENAEKWVALSLDPVRSTHVYWLVRHEYQKSGFGKQSAYDEWRLENDKLITPLWNDLKYQVDGWIERGK